MKTSTIASPLSFPLVPVGVPINLSLASHRHLRMPSRLAPSTDCFRCQLRLAGLYRNHSLRRAEPTMPFSYHWPPQGQRHDGPDVAASFARRQPENVRI